MWRAIPAIAIVSLTVAAVAAVEACGDGGTSPTDCDLICDAGAQGISVVGSGNQGFTIDITCESTGNLGRSFDDHTEFTYDDQDNVTSYTRHIDQEWTFTVTGNVYHVTGFITVDAVQDVISSYSIEVSGGAFGTTPKSCQS